MPTDSDRSLERIEIADLLRLAVLAAGAEAELFKRNPQGSGRYAGRLLGRALCQGAALHYVNGSNGVKDFDVWSFYAEYDDWPFPARWRGTRDFGPSKFGRFPGDPPRYSGRRVDFLGRSLPVRPDVDPAVALRSYLADRRTSSAKALAAKAAVLIAPENRVGEIVWPAVSRGTLRRLAPIDILGQVLPQETGLSPSLAALIGTGIPARVEFQHSRCVFLGVPRGFLVKIVCSA
jgi:hypothetical protein